MTRRILTHSDSKGFHPMRVPVRVQTARRCQAILYLYLPSKTCQSLSSKNICVVMVTAAQRPCDHGDILGLLHSVLGDVASFHLTLCSIEDSLLTIIQYDHGDPENVI